MVELLADKGYQILAFPAIRFFVHYGLHVFGRYTRTYLFTDVRENDISEPLTHSALAN